MMSLKIFFLIVLLASAIIVVLGQPKSNDCVASAGPIQDCSQFIYSNCKNATFIANRLAYTENCSTVSLFWDAPLYNMTISFQSHLTKPYSVCIKPVGCSQAYHTADNGREVAIKWDTFSTEPVCFKTERSDQPTMKFRFDAGNRTHCYGTFIDFSYQV